MSDVHGYMIQEFGYMPKEHESFYAGGERYIPKECGHFAGEARIYTGYIPEECSYTIEVAIPSFLGPIKLANIIHQK